jgi:hypothetical protein
MCKFLFSIFRIRYSGITQLTLEMNDQTAMGLPPVKSTAFFIVILVKCGCLGGTSEMTLLPFREYFFFVSEYCLRPQMASLTVPGERRDKA